MQLLVSVRNVAEAALAADAGIDFIDLKEPGAGALGGLPVAQLQAIVALLRERAARCRISATIGDWPMSDLPGIAAAVDQVAACGVDYVKVGLEPAPAAHAVLAHLAAVQARGQAVVPVFVADHGLDDTLLQQALRAGFPALMVDTADKRRGSLFDVMDIPVLQRFVQQVRDSGAMAGLAGALRLTDAPRLHALAPHFAGFRSAVCAGDRAGAMDAARLHALVATMREPVAA